MTMLPMRHCLGGRRGTCVMVCLAACLILAAACGGDKGTAQGDGGLNANNNHNANANANANHNANDNVNSNANDNANNNNTPQNCDYQHDPALSQGETGDMSGMTAAHNHWRFRVGVPLASWHTGIAANAHSSWSPNMQQAWYQRWVCDMARLPDSNQLPLPSRAELP